MKDKFLAIINSNAVHRVDLTKDGKKNTRDYGYGRAHFSISPEYKAEIVYTDKTESTIEKILIKDKTFNKIVATFSTKNDTDELNRTLAHRITSAPYAAMLDKISETKTAHTR